MEGKWSEDPKAPHLLVRVPRECRVEPLKVTGDVKPLQPQLACNYNIPQAVIAIVQVGYSSYSLLQNSHYQMEKYGYAAYPLTTIPFILLSLVNLVANLCQPQYPAMFLVSYQKAEGNQQPTGKDDKSQPSEGNSTISGAVGRALGEVPASNNLPGFIRYAKSRAAEVSKHLLYFVVLTWTNKN